MVKYTLQKSKTYHQHLPKYVQICYATKINTIYTTIKIIGKLSDHLQCVNGTHSKFSTQIIICLLYS